MKRNVKYFEVILVICSLFFLVGCDKKDTSSTTKIDYFGTYNSIDSDQLTITKDNKANISLYRLTTLEDCNVDEINDNILRISCVDDNAGSIEFNFDYKAKILTVTESTWSLLKNGASFSFDK